MQCITKIFFDTEHMQYYFCVKRQSKLFCKSNRECTVQVVYRASVCSKAWLEIDCPLDALQMTKQNKMSKKYSK